MKATPTTPAELMRAHLVEAAHWPSRIDRALTQLARAADPRYRSRGDTGPGPKNAISDPTGTLAVDIDTDPDLERARQDHAALLDAVNTIEAHARRVDRILGTWAPQAKTGGPGDTENAGIWCANHKAHGRTTPRGADGSRHCDWCATCLRSFGRLPTMALIALHDQGSRIREDVYRRELGLKTTTVAKAPAKTKRGQLRRDRIARLRSAS